MIETLIEYLRISPAVRAGLFFCLGACLGSFITALMHRLPRRLNWTTDRSRCPECGHVLGIVDLVPILSWVFLRGRCRYCATRISKRYPLIEIALGIAFICASVILF